MRATDTSDGADSAGAAPQGHVRREAPAIARSLARTDAGSIGLQQSRHLREESSTALRALLMTPLMTPTHPDFAAVRRHSSDLRDWFARETGWVLHIERDCARLYKRPADLSDPTRGFPDYDKRRYVLFSLTCAVLERADPQITLRLLGERLLLLAAEPELAAAGFSFTLQQQHERRELVAVCRTLLELGVLARVAGDEEAYVRSGAGEQSHDALYDVHRRVLAGVPAAVRGPSTWPRDAAPATIEERLRSLTVEHIADSDEGRRTAIRHGLARRLLDDPVIYFEALEPTARAYLANQRGPMATRLAEASGLIPEQRAEGVALADESGALTDVSMPAEGTEAHVTLLVAEFLANRYRKDGDLMAATAMAEIVSFVSDARERYGSYWRKSAREPGSEGELARAAVNRLGRLQLIAIAEDGIRPLPAIARFGIEAPEIVATKPAAVRSLFELL